ncbi:MAG: putative Undecaprenyl-diphosphatase 1 [Parachlamydiales bacterium]|nr:putative Undecaprenyl-diphosphatase 1 [Parachlamydiales bacterium]
MTNIQALILGIIQGLTEFLPVSSSTHLGIAKQLMGIESAVWMVYFDLMCHFGTLFAVLTLLWKDAWNVLTSIKSIALFTLALLPLVPAYFLFKPLRILLAHDAGAFLLCTSALMFLASSKVSIWATVGADAPNSKRELIWRDALWIGIAQSFALLPGISRSASTISIARILGWTWKDAARFSFLLSIPTILGGSALETIHASLNLASVPWQICIIGFGSSFVMGMVSVRLLFWILEPAGSLNQGSLRPFAWYCLAVGLISLVWLR